MIVLQANHISKQFDGHEVLLDASLVVQDNERVALIGANGAGKSTLLKIVLGEESADTGGIQLAKGATIGYVSQFIDGDPETTVFEFMASAFEHVREMESDLRRMEESMSTPEVYEDEARFAALSAMYDRVSRSFEEAGGFSVETRIRRVLAGLRFPTPMHQQAIGQLSGGQKTRLSLARLLASEPNLLVLDEPTNYLDVDTLGWLEAELTAYQGAVLVVSHDRYFLDQVATVVYELSRGATTRFPGNYSDYMTAASERSAAEAERYEAQQKEIARVEQFVQKNIVRASTTKRAQSRRKWLERMDRLEAPKSSTAKLALAFQCARTSGKDVLDVRDVVVGYPGKNLAGPLRLHVARGQRIAIVGPNGIGKTTLLRTLLGLHAPRAGTVAWGSHVQVGYYDQEQADLDVQKTVLAQVWDEHPQLALTTIRTALGRFLFRGEDVEKPVAALSGGERSRLALCRLMLQQANVLLFDEPTNHLDLPAKEVLEDALQDYDGTILFVSHDRYFIDAIATDVLVVDDAGCRLYMGNYTDYLWKLRAEAAEAARADEGASHAPPNPGPAASSANAPAPSTAPAVAASPDPSARRVRSADVRKLRQRVSDLEAHVATTEAHKSDIEQALIDAGLANDFALAAQLQQALEETSAECEQRVADWEAAAAELEAMERLL